MIKFDAYSATTTAAKVPEVIQAMAPVFGLFADMQLKQGKGFHQFGERLSVTEKGHEVMAIQWGGNHGDRIMFEVKGIPTQKAVEAFRCHFPHRVTRLDACADFDEQGAFNRLYRACMRVKKEHRIKGSKAGDWEDFPEDGRTLYLGGQQSPVRARLYEKGLHPEFRHLSRPDWVRLEVQVRPATSDQKDAYSQITPTEAWGASKWTRDLAAAVLQEHVDPHPAGSVYRLSKRDEALAWMCKQYGHHLMSLRDDLGGWDCVGLTLGELIAAAKTAH